MTASVHNFHRVGVATDYHSFVIDLNTHSSNMTAKTNQAAVAELSAQNTIQSMGRRDSQEVSCVRGALIAFVMGFTAFPGVKVGMMYSPQS